MVGIIKSQYFGALLAFVVPVLQAHFYGGFYRGRTIIGIKGFSLIRWQDGQQALSQLYGALVRKPSEDGVLELMQLFRHLLRDIRVRMPVDIYPPG